MNAETGTEAEHFPEKEFINEIFLPLHEEFKGSKLQEADAFFSPFSYFFLIHFSQISLFVAC